MTFPRYTQATTLGRDTNKTYLKIFQGYTFKFALCFSQVQEQQVQPAESSKQDEPTVSEEKPEKKTRTKKAKEQPERVMANKPHKIIFFKFILNNSTWNKYR